MQGNRGRDTSPERQLRRLLHRRGLRYRVDVRVDPGIRSRADILFPSARVAVFVDGCFWHRCAIHGTSPVSNSEYWQAKLARNVERDRETAHALKTAGWTVVRVWEHERPDEAADRIEAIVRSSELSRHPDNRLAPSSPLPTICSSA